jgi:hypothetical protein
MITLLSALIMGMMFYNYPTSERFLKDAVNILEHDGYAVPERRIHGASVVNFDIFYWIGKLIF